MPLEGREVIFVGEQNRKQRSRSDPDPFWTAVGLGMVGIGISWARCHAWVLTRQLAAFIEKLINLDDKRKYFIVTCGEEVHLAYNRVAYVLSSSSSPFLGRGPNRTNFTRSLTEYFEHRNVGVVKIH